MTEYVRYEITYIGLDGKIYIADEIPTKGWEDQFPQKVLNRVESIVMGGGVIKKMVGYRQ